MKVLFIYYISSGGVETLNRHRIRALTKRGITCHLLYQEQGSGHGNIAGIPTFVLSEPHEIIALIKKQNYDLVVICSNNSLLQRIKLSGYNGVLVYEAQGFGDKNAGRRYFSNAASIIRTYADGILYPKTKHLVELAKTHLPDCPHYSFHNCFDLGHFHYQNGRKLGAPVIGWVGRIEPNKNWKEFLQIAAQFISTNPTLKIWMFIDPTLTSKNQQLRFDRMVNSMSLSSHLTVYHSVSNDKMATHYSEIGDSGGFLCSTSKVEGFGYSLVEAMSCRCPVLTTDSDGVKSIVVDGLSGLYYSQGQITEAVRNGERLLNKTVFRTKMLENAVNHVKTTFSPERYANEFIHMYRSLLNQKKP
jgi:glycosyltransferase involved in cell wall biosynthesis